MSLFKTPVEGALYMFRKGWKVFPLNENEKKPAIFEWQDWAKQANENLITSFARKFRRCNWGVLPVNQTVIDLDCKGERDGLTAFNKLLAERKEDIIETFKVKTPSGGQHWYFTGPCKNSNTHLVLE